MANKIQVRRGVKANLPALSVGEPAFTTDTKQVFIGEGSGYAVNNIELARRCDVNYYDGEFVQGESVLTWAQDHDKPTIKTCIHELPDDLPIQTPGIVEYKFYDGQSNQKVFFYPYYDNIGPYAGYPNNSNKIYVRDFSNDAWSTDWMLIGGAGDESRPNILINGDFQVWQRGGTVFDPSNQPYCVDRWRQSTSTANACKIVKLNAGMAFSPLHTNELIYLTQSLESCRKYFGKVLTLSLEIDGVVYKCTGTLSETAVVVNISADVAAYFQFSNTTEILSVTIQTKNTSIDIGWVKLEECDHATPFISKRYDEELLACQRYFEIIDFAAGVIFYANAITGVRFRVTKRDNPTITVQSCSHVNSGQQLTVTATTKNKDSLTYISFTTGASYALGNGVYYTLFVDAEL